MTKAEARRIIDSMPIPSAQADAARRTIRRATSSEEIEITLAIGELIIKRSRLGKVGFQVLEDTIQPDGSKEVVQKAFDASGNLIHHDPKGRSP
jgi:hypothetical protein